MDKMMHTAAGENASVVAPETGAGSKGATPKKTPTTRTRPATPRPTPARSKVAKSSHGLKNARPAKLVKAQASQPKKTASSSPGPRRVKGREFPPGTKAAIILGLLRKSSGVTIEQIMKATGWQAHSVRGFLSGVVKTELKLKLQSRDDARGKARYSVKP